MFGWFLKGLDGGRPRSTEVARVIGASFGRPDGFGSSGVAQIVDLFILYRSRWVSGAAPMMFIDFLAEEGSNFDNCSWLK